MFNSLRSRIAVAASTATAVVIMIGGGSVLVLVEKAERDALDNRLDEQVDVVVDAVNQSRRTGKPFDAEEFNTLRPDVGTVIRAFQDDELILQAGRRTTTFPLIREDGFNNVIAGNREWRMLSHVTNVDGSDQNDLLVQVAVPTRATDDVIGEFRVRVLLVAVMSALVAAGIGWILCGIAMRPLARLRETTEAVSVSRDLNSRVPDTSGPQEIDDLAMSFNRMLARLQDASRATESALVSSREFAGNAAHEMRTPLTSMGANLEVVSMNPDIPRTQLNSILASVASEQQRLAHLVDALYSLARGEVAENEQKSNLDLADLVATELEPARLRWPGTRIDYVLPPESDSVDVWAWHEGLRMLVANLVSNAVRYGESQVLVEVSTESGHALLAVDDDGPGIEEAERGRIFERFQRGAGVAPGGSGLGLALVEQQVRFHGATIEITDSDLGGARFAVRFPKAKDCRRSSPNR
jgi:two-component system, OmpR family, sensor histidine kinase PrrB